MINTQYHCLTQEVNIQFNQLSMFKTDLELETWNFKLTDTTAPAAPADSF